LDALHLLTLSAALATLLLLGGVVVFLGIEGAPALSGTSENLPAGASSIWALAWPLLYGSVWASFLAILLAVPVGVGVAVFAVFMARGALGRWLGTAIDVLAAVPSVVYGLWGLAVIAPRAVPVYEWLSTRLGWIPFFAGTPSTTGRTILTAALVLAVMILPIVSSVSREAIRLVPSSSTEGAQALGATRWEMIRTVVLPEARSGIVAGVMLALGRALGETMAVAMVLSPKPFLVSLRLLTSENPGTVAAYIAQNYPEAHGLEVNALIWLGLLLFAVTFAVSFLARAIVRRSGGGSR
jgi:phosphate transport system permease protein